MIPEFYGLSQDAFSLSPDLDFLYLSKPHEEAVAHLVYGLEQNEDIILLCGDIGTGKTLALHRLVDQVSKSFDVVVITVTTLDFDEFLRLILLKLGVDVAALSGTATLIFGLEKRLVEARSQGRKVLLVVDECQNLNPAALESVRLIMNLGQPGGQVLQLVLAGQLGLRANLNLPELRQLRQRIRVDYQLEYMTREELAGYIEHRLQVAGRIEPLFRSDALDEIQRLSQGIPRVVNYLASKALLAGFVDESKIIKAKHIEEYAPGAPLEQVSPLASAPVESITRDDLPEMAQPVPERGVATQPMVSTTTRPTISRSEVRPNKKGNWWPMVRIVLIVLTVAALAYVTQSQWRPLMEFGSDSAATNESLGQNHVSEVNKPGSHTVDLLPEPRVKESESQPKTVALPVPAYVIHVASFREFDRAQNFSRKLERMGYTSKVLSVANSRDESWNRVLVSGFASEEAARELAVNLKAAGTISYYKILNDSAFAD